MMQLRIFSHGWVTSAKAPSAPNKTGLTDPDPLADLDTSIVDAADAELRARIEADESVRPSCRCDRPVLAVDDGEPQCVMCGRSSR